MTACQCSPCGREFSSLSGFDRHQTTNYGTATPVTCHDPATRGLAIDRHGRWALPSSGRSGRSGLSGENLTAERHAA